MSKSKSYVSVILEYESKCGRFSIDRDEDGRSYIYTERFRAETINTDQTSFESFPYLYKELYNVTFNDSDVMRTFGNGVVRTVEEFETFIKEESFLSSHRNPFSSFIICDEIGAVGREAIKNGDGDRFGNFAECGYLFNKQYHSITGKYKNVGYENIGALIWGYGKDLYERKAKLGQIYQEQEDKLLNTKDFTAIYATARTDNIGSIKILESLGFNKLGIVDKYGHERYEFELSYQEMLDDSEVNILG